MTYPANVSSSTPTKKDLKSSDDEDDDPSSSDEEEIMRQRRRLEEMQEAQRAWIPPYLSKLIAPYCEDIWCSPFFDPRLVAQLMAEGFLPIASRDMLLPKLHAERCVVKWPDFHVSKSVKKKAKRWAVTIDADFDGVVAGCHARHGEAWLYPNIVAAFRRIRDASPAGVRTPVVSAGGDGRRPAPRGGGGGRRRPVRLCSVEVWNESSGELVAGELGYTVGDVYTSLTGYASEDGAGSAQLAGLGVLLRRAGFRLWDMGMWLDYKERLGARQIPRADFVEEMRRAREEAPDVTLDRTGRWNVGELLKSDAVAAPNGNKTKDAPPNVKKKKDASNVKKKKSKCKSSNVEQTGRPFKGKGSSTSKDESDGGAPKKGNDSSSSSSSSSPNEEEVKTATDDEQPCHAKRSREISPVSVQSLARQRLEKEESERREREKKSTTKKS